MFENFDVQSDNNAKKVSDNKAIFVQNKQFNSDTKRLSAFLLKLHIVDILLIFP